MSNTRAELVFFSQFHCGACVAFKGTPGNSPWDTIAKDKSIVSLGVKSMIYEIGTTVDDNGEKITYTLGNEYVDLVKSTPHILLRLPGTKIEGVSYGGNRDPDSVIRWVINQLETNPLFNKQKRINTVNTPRNNTNNYSRLEEKREAIRNYKNNMEALISSGYNKSEAVRIMREKNNDPLSISKAILKNDNSPKYHQHPSTSQNVPQNTPQNVPQNVPQKAEEVVIVQNKNNNSKDVPIENLIVQTQKQMTSGKTKASSIYENKEVANNLSRPSQVVSIDDSQRRDLDINLYGSVKTQNNRSIHSNNNKEEAKTIQSSSIKKNNNRRGKVIT